MQEEPTKSPPDVSTVSRMMKPLCNPLLHCRGLASDMYRFMYIIALSLFDMDEVITGITRVLRIAMLSNDDRNSYILFKINNIIL